MTDRLVRLALRAYPAAARARDGEVLLQLSRELVANGASPLRECAGLVREGVSARARLAAGDLAAAPWRAARSRLALALAAALLALVAVGAFRWGEGPAAWGWSWTLAVLAAGCALAGAAWGRRWVASAGALAVTALLALDAVRDLSGAGSRWVVEVGGIAVDPLVMWIGAGALLIVAAEAVPTAPAVSAGAGVCRAAWGVLPACALVVLGRTSPEVADAILIQGAPVLAAAALVAGIARRRRDPAGALAGALVALAAAAPAAWLLAGLVPAGAGVEGMLALALFAAAGALATAGAVTVARAAGRAAGGG